MAKTRNMKPKKEQPEQWATNIRARIPASEVFDFGKPTSAERGMLAIMTRQYASVGPEGYTLKKAQQEIQGVGWKQLFDTYADFCGRVEHLLIIMMQTNTPMYEGTQINIRANRDEIVRDIGEEFECFITNFRTTYLEKHKLVMLEVHLCKGNTHAPYEPEEGYNLDNLPM